MDTCLLEIHALTKTYPQPGKKSAAPVINNLGLKLLQGERIGVTGPSGCGKTTLLRLISGLEEADSGCIIMNGDVAAQGTFSLSPHKRGLGFVFQSPALWPHMTVEENISYVSCEKTGIKELLSDFEIADLAKRYPSQISGGQAKRAAIARAIASGSRLLLMDEPLTNLDRGLKESILKALVDYLDKTETALIYVTHDEGELDSIVSKSYRLAGGVLHDM